MSEQQIFEIPASIKAKAWIDNDTYLKMYKELAMYEKGHFLGVLE